MYELLSMMGSECKDTVRVKEDKKREMDEAEKKKEALGEALMNRATKRGVDDKRDSGGDSDDDEHDEHDEPRVKKRRGRGPARETGDDELKLFAKELKEGDLARAAVEKERLELEKERLRVDTEDRAADRQERREEREARDSMFLEQMKMMMELIGKRSS